MAEQVQIKGSGSSAKVRNPVGVAVIDFITLGIYGIFWYYFVNKEMAELGKAKGTPELGDSPGTSVLAITLGALIIVPAVISFIHTFKRVQAAQRLAGAEPLNGWLGLVLGLVLGPVLYGYMQSGLNQVWESGSLVEALPAGPAGPSSPTADAAAEAKS